MLSEIEGWVALLAFVVGGVLGGLGVHYHDADAIAKQQLAQQQHITQLASDNADLQKKLDDEHAIHTTKTVYLTKRVPYVVTHYVPAPGAATQSRPDYFLTVGSLVRWNDALASGPSGAPGASSAYGAVDSLALSRVTFADALDNHIINAERCQDAVDQVNGWIQWYQDAQAKLR